MNTWFHGGKVGTMILFIIQALNIENIHSYWSDLTSMSVASVCMEVHIKTFYGCFVYSFCENGLSSISVTNLIVGSKERLVKASMKLFSPISFLNSETILLTVLKRLYIFWFWLLHWDGFRVPMKWDICLNTLLALNSRSGTFSAAWKKERSC